MTPKTYLEYTLREGGYWHGTHVAVEPKAAAAHYEALEAEWAPPEGKTGIVFDRRVGVVGHPDKLQACAVRLPDGRVFDAILGRFR